MYNSELGQTPTLLLPVEKHLQTELHVQPGPLCHSYWQVSNDLQISKNLMICRSTLSPSSYCPLRFVSGCQQSLRNSIRGKAGDLQQKKWSKVLNPSSKHKIRELCWVRPMVHLVQYCVSHNNQSISLMINREYRSKPSLAVVFQHWALEVCCIWTWRFPLILSYTHRCKVK